MICQNCKKEKTCQVKGYRLFVQLMKEKINKIILLLRFKEEDLWN